MTKLAAAFPRRTASLIYSGTFRLGVKDRRLGICGIARSGPCLPAVCWRLRVSVDPGGGELNGEFFRLLRGFETIAQPAYGMGVTPTFALPGNFRSGAPLLCALVERSVGDDQTILIK